MCGLGFIHQCPCEERSDVAISFIELMDKFEIAPKGVPSELHPQTVGYAMTANCAG